MTAQGGLAGLSCGCTRMYQPLPKIGDTVYCTRHPNTVTMVLSLTDRTWRARCREHRCRFGRLGNEADVVTFANRHTLNFPDHEVVIFHNEVKDRVVTLDGGQSFEGMGRAVVEALTETEPWDQPALCGHVECSYACSYRDGQYPF